MDAPLVDSVKIFKTHWILWEIMGIHHERFPYKTLLIIHSVLVNTLISFGYPTHLIIGLFTNDDAGDYAKSLAMISTCIAASVKLAIFAYKLPNLREMERLLRHLDKRAVSAEEQKCFEGTRRSALFVLRAFEYCVGGVVVSYISSAIFKKNCSLMQPGWLPWDWRNSLAACRWSNFYQTLGLWAGLQNVGNDSYAPMVLCVLAGHIKLLGILLSRIGYDNTNQLENERQLLECVKNQKHMYRLFDIVHDIISVTMLVQFLTTVFNVCMVVFGLLFYATTTVDRLFYVCYFSALLVEISSICYYGSVLELVQGQVHNSAFASNWMDQSVTYKRHMLLFMVRAMKRTEALAGNIVPVNLTTYFSIIKGTYSLFMLVQKVNDRQGN